MFSQSVNMKIFASGTKLSAGCAIVNRLCSQHVYTILGYYTGCTKKKPCHKNRRVSHNHPQGGKIACPRVAYTECARYAFSRSNFLTIHFRVYGNFWRHISWQFFYTLIFLHHAACIRPNP